MQIPETIFLLAGSLITLAGVGKAQDADRPSPEKLLEAKLDSAFLKKADWVVDYDLALKRARTDKKPILGYFTTAGY